MQVKLLALLAAVAVTALLFVILFVALPAAFSFFVVAVVQPWFDSLTPADSIKVKLIGKFMLFVVPVVTPALAAILIARRRAKQAVEDNP